jgi:heat shock protein HslJ
VTPGDLAGTAWGVAAVDKRPLPAEGRPAVLAFGADGRVAGLGGVNRFSGPWSLRDGELVAGPLVSTRKGGPPEWMAVEARLLELLGRPLRVERTPAGLVLADADGEIALVPASAPG